MIVINRYRCGYCGACVSVCPSDALDLVETFIEVGDKCSNCGICAKVCNSGKVVDIDISTDEVTVNGKNIIKSPYRIMVMVYPMM